MITYSKPSKYDVCACNENPIVNIDFGHVTVSLCRHCFGELGTDADILETFGIDSLVNKEVK